MWALKKTDSYRGRKEKFNITYDPRIQKHILEPTINMSQRAKDCIQNIKYRITTDFKLIQRCKDGK